LKEKIEAERDKLSQYRAAVNTSEAWVRQLDTRINKLQESIEKEYDKKKVLEEFFASETKRFEEEKAKLEADNEKLNLNREEINMSATKTKKDEKKKQSASGGTEKKSTKKETKKKTASKSSKPEAKKISPPAEEEHGFLTEAAENIEAGAEVVGEKVSQIAQKTAEVAGEVFEAVKKGFSTAYDTGAKVVDEITHTAHEYAEKYKHNVEVKRLSEERDRLIAGLGLITFVKHKIKKAAPRKLLEEKEILDLIKEIEKLDREIVKIGKELEKGE
jgi:hypothetical protein